MKRSWILRCSAMMLFVIAAGTGFSQADSAAVVSDMEAAQLFGGACEFGKVHVRDGECGVEGEDDEPAYGCRFKKNFVRTEIPGSYHGRTEENCGATPDCGTAWRPSPCAPL